MLPLPSLVPGCSIESALFGIWPKIGSLLYKYHHPYIKIGIFPKLSPKEINRFKDIGMTSKLHYLLRLVYVKRTTNLFAGPA